MSALIDTNECSWLVDKQLKQDCINNNKNTKKEIAHQAAIIIRKKQTKMELAQFLHALMFSPVPSTFTKAIDKNNFTTWPGLSSKLIKRHLPSSIATAKGHLHLERQGLQSTKPKINVEEIRNKIK